MTAMNPFGFCVRRGILMVSLLTANSKGGKMTKHHGAHLYCVLYKNTGMPDRKYMSHISDNCFGKRSDQHSIKYGLGGALVNRSDAVK